MAQSAFPETWWCSQLLKLLLDFHHATTPFSICHRQEKTPTITPTKHLPTISHTCNHRCYAIVSGGHPWLAELLPPILLTPLCHLCANTLRSNCWKSITTKKWCRRGTAKPTEENIGQLSSSCAHHFRLNICGQCQSATCWRSLEHHCCYYGYLDPKLHLNVLPSRRLVGGEHTKSQTWS